MDLSPQAAHSGRAGLSLRAVADDPENKPSVVETPPLWVTSAPVNVHEGDLVHIQGWLRIAQPITGSVDGLLVIDTLSGEALAQRVVSTDEWRQFSLFRCAPRSGPMAVTFALSGLGEAWIDDVTIQLVTRASPPQQAQTTPTPRLRRRPLEPVSELRGLSHFASDRLGSFETGSSRALATGCHSRRSRPAAFRPSETKARSRRGLPGNSETPN